MVTKSIYFDDFEAKKVFYVPVHLSVFAQLILAAGTLFIGIFTI